MAFKRPQTLAEVRHLLYRHVTADPLDEAFEFRDALNEVLERVYQKGIWREHVKTLPVDEWIEDHVLTLPYEYESMLAVNVDGNPTPIFDEYLEFSPNGPGEGDAGQGGLNIVDLRFHLVNDVYLRRYKFLMNVSQCEVRAQLHERFILLDDDLDLVKPSNVGALKCGLFAVIYENEGDLDQSEKFWTKCWELLGDAKHSNSIGVNKPLPQTPFSSTVTNMM